MKIIKLVKKGTKAENSAVPHSDFPTKQTGDFRLTVPLKFTAHCRPWKIESHFSYQTIIKLGLGFRLSFSLLPHWPQLHDLCNLQWKKQKKTQIQIQIDKRVSNLPCNFLYPYRHLRVCLSFLSAESPSVYSGTRSRHISHYISPRILVAKMKKKKMLK